MDAILAQAHAALLCLICKDELKRPASIPCGHNFCEACIILSLESRGNQCPECHQPCWRNDVIRNQMLENLVSRLHDTQPLATQLMKGRSSQFAAASNSRPASQTPKTAFRKAKGSTAPPQSAGKVDQRSKTPDPGLKRQSLNEELHEEGNDQGLRQPGERTLPKLDRRGVQVLTSKGKTAVERLRIDKCAAAALENRSEEDRSSFLVTSLGVDETPETLAPLREPLSTQEERKLEAAVAAQERELRQIDEQLIAVGVDPETRLSQLETESQDRSGLDLASPMLRAPIEGHVPQHSVTERPAEAQKEGIRVDNVSKKEATEKRERGRAKKAGILEAQDRALRRDVKIVSKEKSCQEMRSHETREGLQEDERKHRTVEPSERPEKRRRRPKNGSDKKGRHGELEVEPRQEVGIKGRKTMEPERTVSDAEIDPFAFQGIREKILEGNENDEKRASTADGRKQKKRKGTKVGLATDDEKKEGGLKSNEVGRKSNAVVKESSEQKQEAHPSEPSFLDSPVVEESPQVAYKRRKRKDISSAAGGTGGKKAAHKRTAGNLQGKCDAGADLVGLGEARQLPETKREESRKKKQKSQGPNTVEKHRTTTDGKAQTDQTGERRTVQAEERASEAVAQKEAERAEEQLSPSKGAVQETAQKGESAIDRVIAETPEKDDFDDWGLGLEDDELDEEGLVKRVKGRETPLQERLEAAAPQKTGPLESPSNKKNEEGPRDGADLQKRGQLAGAEARGRRKGGDDKAYERAVKSRGAKREPLREVSNARTKKLRSPDSDASFRKDLREAIARSLSNC